MNIKKPLKAVVLHSGGMDSSICLRLAIEEFGVENITAVCYKYGQRHAGEIQVASEICAAWGVRQRIFNLDILNEVTSSALLDPSQPIEHKAGLPANTLIVGRNGLMVRLGAIYANHIGAQSVWIGVLGLESANSGYRDCSRAYMDLQEQILRLDLANSAFEIRTPLVAMTKAETMEVADRLGILDYLLAKTITCYEGLPGEGCGRCPACRLRLEGIQQFRETLKKR